jgi:hypothetical protein
MQIGFDAEFVEEIDGGDVEAGGKCNP